MEKRKPNLGYLKVWGCLAKIKILDNKKKKIGPKIVDSIFIGYALDSNASRLLVINSKISKISNNIVIESWDTTYFENINHRSKIGGGSNELHAQKWKSSQAIVGWR